MLTTLNTDVAVWTVRIIAGIVFLCQGYDKIFRVGLRDVRATLEAGMSHTPVPRPLIGAIALLTSWLEFGGGLLLLLGLFTHAALYALCLDLVLVAVGFSLSRPMWDASHVWFRLSLILFLLLMPDPQHCLALDCLLHR